MLEPAQSPVQAGGTEWRHLGKLGVASQNLCVNEMLHLIPPRSGDRGLHPRNLAQGWLLGLDEIVANDRGIAAVFRKRKPVVLRREKKFSAKLDD